MFLFLETKTEKSKRSNGKKKRNQSKRKKHPMQKTGKRSSGKDFADGPEEPLRAKEAMLC